MNKSDEYVVEMRKLFNFIRVAENSIQAGRNRATGRWLPHKSVEGGTETIGYGHKLTEEEKHTGRIYDKDMQYGITDSAVEEILALDIQAHSESAKRYVGPKAWESLSQNQKSILTAYSYNVGLSKFPKFTTAIIKGDWETAKKEYVVKSKGKTLARNKLFYDKYLRPNIDGKGGKL